MKNHETMEEYLKYLEKEDVKEWELRDEKADKAGIDLELLHILAMQVLDEVLDATLRHGHIKSPHEGYGVILEEVDELWDHVKANTVKSEDCDKELTQIAAMAIKMSMDCVTY